MMKKKSSVIKHFLSKKNKPTSGHKHTDDKKKLHSGKASNSKKIWSKILSNPNSRNLLKNSWTSDNPQKTYEKTIKNLAKKFDKKQ